MIIRYLHLVFNYQPADSITLRKINVKIITEIYSNFKK